MIKNDPVRLIDAVIGCLDLSCLYSTIFVYLIHLSDGVGSS